MVLFEVALLFEELLEVTYLLVHTAFKGVVMFFGESNAVQVELESTLADPQKLGSLRSCELRARLQAEFTPLSHNFKHFLDGLSASALLSCPSVGLLLLWQLLRVDSSELQCLFVRGRVSLRSTDLEEERVCLEELFPEDDGMF